MGASVSRLPSNQLAYWLNIKETDGNGEGTDEDTRYLSYNTFLVLSVLGGFIGLDHLYLRSPLTCLAKTIVNFSCFGFWWIYDILQALFNKDVIKVFGLNVPGFGPYGIGAGCLINDVPDPKHLAFLMYGLALVFGGMIGLDSFIVGQSYTGLMRIISLLSFIFIPVSIFTWLYNLFMFFFRTTVVTNNYNVYFGAPKRSLSDQLFSAFSFLGPFFEPFKKTFDAPFNAFTSGANVVMGVINVVTLIITGGIDIVKGLLVNAVPNVKNVMGLQQKLTQKVVEQSLESGVKAVEAVKDSLGPKKGGALIQSNIETILPYIFLATIVFVSVSGFVSTYRRSKKTKDDSPPEPGIPRESTEIPS